MKKKEVVKIWEDECDERMKDYNTRNLDIGFNPFVKPQTYNGYANHYQKIIENMVTDDSSNIELLLNAIRMEVKCRERNIKSRFCL